MAIDQFFKKFNLALSHARYVKTHYQRDYIAQFFDLIALCRVNHTCNISDYYKYGVFNVPRGAALYKELLGSDALEAFSRSLNPRHTVSAAWDKMLFAIICNAYAIRTTEILAIYKPVGLVPDFVKNHLTDISQLKAFLVREKGPVFIKPVKGALGQGAFLIAEVDKACEQVIDQCGNTLSFEEFYTNTIGMTGATYYNSDAGILLQRPVVQHQAITEFTQTEAPSGLRVLVLNTGSGPYIHRAIWKIIAPGNISDNFSRGKRGNMVAQVDPATGKVSSAINGYWPSSKLYAEHPVSGRKFASFTLPLWQQVTSEILRASSAIFGMGAMHWDIIVTDSGPVFLELNDFGGTEFLQLHGLGLIDPDLKKTLQRVAVLQQGNAFSRFVLRN